MKFLRAAEAGAWLIAACVLAAAVWPGWSAQSAREAARLAAESIMGRVVAREHQLLAERGGFIGFGPQGAERNDVLSGVDLGQDSRLFDMDAWLDEAGHLHIRVVSQPDMVRQGNVAPVLAQVELPPVLPVSGT